MFQNLTVDDDGRGPIFLFGVGGEEANFAFVSIEDEFPLFASCRDDVH